MLRPLLVVLLLASAARAQGDGRPVVDIVLVGRLGEDPVFGARVSSWFPPERFVVQVRRARFLDPKQVLAPGAEAAVHVWVTLTGADLARLYLSSAAQGEAAPSYFLRDLRLESGLDEIGAEHLAEALSLSTQAFLDGQAHSAREDVERTLSAEQAPPPAATEPPPSKPTPPPALVDKAEPASPVRRSTARREWGAAVGYGVSYRADEGTWHGPRLSLAAFLTRRLGLRVGVQGALPRTRELAPLELRFYGASFLVAAGLRHSISDTVTFEWFIGPGIDVVRYDPVRPLSAEYSAAAPATEARPEGGFGLVASFGRAPIVSLIAEATVPLTKTHYDIVQDDSRRVIARASPIVPTLGLEVGF